jgi:hypothetical protein
MVGVMVGVGDAVGVGVEVWMGLGVGEGVGNVSDPHVARADRTAPAALAIELVDTLPIR